MDIRDKLLNDEEIQGMISAEKTRNDISLSFGRAIQVLNDYLELE